MTKNITAVLILLIVVLVVHAQQPAAWKFHSINQAGLLVGENQSAAQLISVNGFQHKSVFAGIGTGLDFHEYRSIPLFADFRKYFGRANNKVFVYADAGVNFVWQAKANPYVMSSTYKPAFYGGAGVGYFMPFKNNGAGFILSAGFSRKNVRYDQKLYNFCPQGDACIMYQEIYKLDYNRLLLQMALLF